MYPYISRRVLYVDEAESLTGFVLGQRASDLEERTARALDKIGIPYRFRVRISPLIPGRLTEAHGNVVGEVELDFLCFPPGQIYPLFIDGEIAHYMAEWQKELDEEKKAKADNALRAYNAQPSVRIPFWKLNNQAAADKTIREIFKL